MSSLLPSRSSSFLRWGASAFAVALALGACGGGGDSGPVAVTPVSTTSAQPDQVAAFGLAQRAVAAASVRLPTAAPALLPMAAPGENMLFNGSFESGMTAWSNWDNAVMVAEQASGGASSLRVGTGAGGAGQTVGAIVPGTTYRFTAKAKVSAAPDSVYVGVNFTDGSGEPLKQHAVPVGSTTYTTAMLEVIAPPGAVQAVVYVWKNAGSGFAYVDEFDFGVARSAQPGTVGSFNIVANGEFDRGLAGWENWGNAGTTSTQVATGAAAAQVGTGPGGFGQRIENVFPGTYRVSANAKVSTPGEIGYLGVMFTDSAGTGLAVQSAPFRSTTYAMVQADLTLPPGATKALVFVWKNDGPGFAYVDDIKLVQLASDPNAPGPEIVASAPVGAPVIQLPWGGEVSGQFTSGISNELRRYENGLQVGPAATVTCGNTFCTATVLRGGGYAAVWIEHAVEPGVLSYRLYTQAYTAAAQPVGSPVAVVLTRIVSDISGPPAVPQLAPLAGGGYVVVWALQQDTPGGASDQAVYTQRFDASGNAAGPAQQATADGAGFLDIIGTTTGGYVVSWGKTGTVGGARAYGPDGAPLAPEQAAGLSWEFGAGPRGAMAPLAGGGAAVVGHVLNGPVVVQHISASGVALAAQVASSLGSPGRALVTVAGLPDGGSLVAWTELSGGNVYARRYAADGTPQGPQTRVTQATTASSGTQILVFADGRFAISWEVGSTAPRTRYSRTFPANGLVAP